MGLYLGDRKVRYVTTYCYGEAVTHNPMCPADPQVASTPLRPLTAWILPQMTQGLSIVDPL